MHLLQRHIFKNVFFTCVAAVGVFTFVLVAANALKDLLGYLLADQVSPGTFFSLLLLLVPYAAVFALPIGILTGVLLVLGRMSAQNEVTAMRAAGMSLGYIARPVFVLGGLCLGLALLINLYSGPQARLAYVRMRDEIRRSGPERLLVPKTFVRDFAGLVIYLGEKKGADVRDVWVWKLDKQKRTREFVRARSGRLDYNETNRTIVLTLKDAAVEVRDEKQPEVFSNTDFQAKVGVLPIEFNLAGIFDREARRPKPDWLTIDELRLAKRLIEEGAPLPVALGGGGAVLPPEEAPVRAMKISMALHNKVAGALAVFVFAVLAVPLGIKVSRRETSANLGVAVALVMAYFFMTTVIGWLENFPALRPDLLLWVPPLAFLALGVALFRRIGRA